MKLCGLTALDQYYYACTDYTFTSLCVLLDVMIVVVRYAKAKALRFPGHQIIWVFD